MITVVNIVAILVIELFIVQAGLSGPAPRLAGCQSSAMDIFAPVPA